MSTKVKLPELGEGVTEGELIKWLVNVGDHVKPDQAIAEIMTDKATVEVPTPVEGVIQQLHFKVGEMIKVDSVMITLEGSSMANPKSESAPKAQPAPTSSPSVQTPPQTSSHSGSASGSASGSGGGHVIGIKLPELGEGVTEGELIKYLVQVGDVIKPDQAIAEIMTDKATVEVPSPYAGQVTELKFKAGDIIKVESLLALLKSTDVSAAASSASPSHASATPSAPAASVPPSPQTNAATSAIFPPVADSRVLATPATRKLAREMNVDINVIAGSGLAGRVTREDVLKAPSNRGTQSATTSASKTQTASIPRPAFNSNLGALEERVAIRGIRKKIAENMQMSKAIIPHFTLMDEADVSELVKIREELKSFAEKHKTKITYLPFVMKALIATMREFPMVNASIDDAAQEIVYKKYFNIGFAADTPNGLVVPVIKNADQKTLLQISQEILDLSLRARDGKLKSDEMKGATITITNIGSVGGTYATPIINHPEVAILGMYKIQDRLILKDNQVSSIKTMNFTITADHRLIDGATAAQFLRSFLGRIQHPGILMMELA